MKPVKSDVSFPQLEESILQFWKDNQIVEKNLNANEGAAPFLFYDGPPFATGLPHYGHILAGTLKDVVPRYWVMRGRHCRRRWGWDCHGLPIEFEMEKELGLSGLQDIQKYGIANFNEACRGTVLKYTREWERIVGRTGRWADFKNAYRTMDKPFMESVWWAVKQLWDKGLVYEGYRVMPYSWRITTPLSNFEASLNYQSVQDPALTVRFKEEGADRYFLAWTTTPWTLPSNLALAMGPDIDYKEVRRKGEKHTYVLAAASSITLEGDIETVATHKGRAFEGRRYEPLFPYFADKKKEGAFKVVLGDYVATGEGTGIVHTAPAFGEDDFQVAKKNGIPLVDPVDSEGNFTALVPDYEGKNVKEADKDIIRDLKAKGAVIRHDTLVHNYPYCYRSDTPLIYKAISTWFLKLDGIKDQLVANNKKTHWVPEHLRDGRFGNWLEAARDWNISRNRFWGTPIPIWRGEDGEMHCVGSVEELEKLSGKKFDDLHKHFIDDVVIKSPKTGKPLRRIPEVFDCWFESGSMPYAQAHYPFENREQFEKNFPAEFIAEGLDQTRGWFYTLSVLSTALFNVPPFKNVIVNGLVLAEDGKKMSKRLKNYPDVNDVLNSHGADALRVALMNSPASHADDVRFSEASVKEVVRSVVLPLWNAYSFFVTYALADGWQVPAKPEVSPTNDLDRWIVSRLQTLIKVVDEKMAIYHLYEVVPSVLSFIDDLTNWYIRLNRRRFWAEEQSADKNAAYGTLYYVLTQFSRVLAPFMPFVTDELYRNLEAGPGKPESIHLARWPELQTKLIDEKLEAGMELVRRVVSMGRNCRNNTKIKTRQPLKELTVITPNAAHREVIEHHAALIRDELNVKKVSFSDDEKKWVDFAVKPNWKELGKKYGAKSKERAAEISAMPFAKLVKDVAAEEYVATRTPKQEGAMLSEGEVTLWLDTKLDDSLVAEGMAREFVNRVQKLRKDMGLEVTDRISLTYEAPTLLAKALDAHRVYIGEETLAAKLATGAGPWTAEQDLDGHALKVRIDRA